MRRIQEGAPSQPVSRPFPQSHDDGSLPLHPTQMFPDLQPLYKLLVSRRRATTRFLDLTRFSRHPARIITQRLASTEVSFPAILSPSAQISPLLRGLHTVDGEIGSGCRIIGDKRNSVLPAPGLGGRSHSAEYEVLRILHVIIPAMSRNDGSQGWERPACILDLKKRAVAFGATAPRMRKTRPNNLEMK